MYSTSLQLDCPFSSLVLFTVIIEAMIQTVDPGIDLLYTHLYTSPPVLKHVDYVDLSYV